VQTAQKMKESGVAEEQAVIGECFVKFCLGQRQEFLLNAFALDIQRMLPMASAHLVFRPGGAYDDDIYFTDAREANPQRYWRIACCGRHFLLPNPLTRQRFDDGNRPRGFLLPPGGEISPATLHEFRPAVLVGDGHRWEIGDLGRVNRDEESEPSEQRSANTRADLAVNVFPMGRKAAASPALAAASSASTERSRTAMPDMEPVATCRQASQETMLPPALPRKAPQSTAVRAEATDSVALSKPSSVAGSAPTVALASASSELMPDLMRLPDHSRHEPGLTNSDPDYRRNGSASLSNDDIPRIAAVGDGATRSEESDKTALEDAYVRFCKNLSACPFEAPQKLLEGELRNAHLDAHVRDLHSHGVISPGGQSTAFDVAMNLKGDAHGAPQLPKYWGIWLLRTPVARFLLPKVDNEARTFLDLSVFAKEGGEPWTPDRLVSISAGRLVERRRKKDFEIAPLPNPVEVVFGS